MSGFDPYDLIAQAIPEVMKKVPGKEVSLGTPAPLPFVVQGEPEKIRVVLVSGAILIEET